MGRTHPTGTGFNSLQVGSKQMEPPTPGEISIVSIPYRQAQNFLRICILCQLNGVSIPYRQAQNVLLLRTENDIVIHCFNSLQVGSKRQLQIGKLFLTHGVSIPYRQAQNISSISTAKDLHIIVSIPYRQAQNPREFKLQPREL